MYVGCAISCRYRVPEPFQDPSHGLALENKVEHAIAQAILQHPVFTAGRINEDSKKQYWIRLDHIDFNNHITWQTIPNAEEHLAALHDALDWQVNERYTNLETQPQWRVTILKSVTSDFIDIIFAWDHTAGDGKSGRMFHDSLLQCLNKKAENLNEIVLKDRSFRVPVTDFTPPLHQLLKLPVSLPFMFSVFANDLVSQKKSVKAPQTAAWAPIEMGPLVTRLKTITLDATTLNPVLHACRQHETTLTGLLHGLIAVSMAARLSEDKALAFECGTPVCLRQFQEPGTSTINLNRTAINGVVYWPYIFGPGIVRTFREQIDDIKTNPELNKSLQGTVWSTAKKIREEVSAKLKLGAKNDLIGLAKFITDWKSYLMDNAKARTHSWEVSNLGVMEGKSLGDAGETDSWEIKEATFTQSAAVLGAALTFSAISVKGGGLTISCCWQTGVVDDELAEGVTVDVETWLNDLGHNGSLEFVL